MLIYLKMIILLSVFLNFLLVFINFFNLFFLLLLNWIISVYVLLFDFLFVIDSFSFMSLERWNKNRWR